MGEISHAVSAGCVFHVSHQVVSSLGVVGLTSKQKLRATFDFISTKPREQPDRSPSTV